MKTPGKTRGQEELIADLIKISRKKTIPIQGQRPGRGRGSGEDGWSPTIVNV